jgi:hypothetical protein
MARPTKYDWPTLADGQVHVLDLAGTPPPGQRSSVAAFRSSLATHAHRYGLEYRTKRLPDQRPGVLRLAVQLRKAGAGGFDEAVFGDPLVGAQVIDVAPLCTRCRVYSLGPDGCPACDGAHTCPQCGLKADVADLCLHCGFDPETSEPPAAVDLELQARILAAQ